MRTWRTVAWIAGCDSRTERGRLALFAACISIGVGGLVALGALREHLLTGLDDQVRVLMGADVIVSSRIPFADADLRILRGLGEESVHEITVSSMAAFPEAGRSRLVSVSGFDGPYPLHGETVTEPLVPFDPAAGDGAWVDAVALRQNQTRVGSEIRLGGRSIPVVTSLGKAPGRPEAFNSLSPRIWVPLSFLLKSGLVESQSLAFHRVHLKTKDAARAEEIREQIRTTWPGATWQVETVGTRRETIASVVEQLGKTLDLAAFGALILGAAGVTAAVLALIRKKMASVAILQALGAPRKLAARVFLLEAWGVGLVGGAIGVLGGVLAEAWLLNVLADQFPVPPVWTFPWKSSVAGMIAAVGVCGAFGFLPMLMIRGVPPLAVLREEALGEGYRLPRLAVMGWLLALVLGGLGLVIFLTGHWRTGLGLAAGTAFVVAFLFFVAKGILWAGRGLTGNWAAFPERQGWANLGRPGNRTGLLVTTFGLAVFVTGTMEILRHNFAAEQLASGLEMRANAVLFDVQPDQVEPLRELLTREGVVIWQEAPLVTMRIVRLRGVEPMEYVRRDGEKPPGWTLRREFRSSYRGKLNPRERLMAGEWIPEWSGGGGPVPVSMEKELAADLGLELGDVLVVNVQGLEMELEVTSLREVDWRRFEPNFFMVFPAGVFEGAPQTNLFFVESSGDEMMDRMQHKVTETFPNVSALDFRELLETIEGLVRQAVLAVSALAGLTAVTGFLILLAVLSSSRFQRQRECVLLASLGATRAVLFRILLVEFMVLGGVATLAGLVLAVGGAWAVTYFWIDLPFGVPWGMLVAMGVLVPILTSLGGWWSSRGLMSLPPIEALRSASGHGD